MKHLLLILFVCLIGTGQGWAQGTINVKGQVLDESQIPVIGASVLVKGTQKGQITDIDGNFHFDGLKKSDVLVISYVGMKKQEVGVKPQLKVVLLADSELLDEVIVTAFGTAKRSAFTGSATVLGSQKIEKKQVSNVLESLVGEVAGLQMSPSTAPGSTSSILIRGEGSINAGTDPLIVVDGMPYDGGWNNINPQDVESVTVTKDAASNALYGARGANGVITITTKKGAQGKGVVSFDAKWGANMRGERDYDMITSPGQYYELYYKALRDSYLSKGSSAYEAHVKANENLFGDASLGGLGYNIYTVPDGEYLIGSNGKLNPNATLGRRIYNNGNVYTLYPDDWKEAAYRTGLRQEYNVSVSGGGNGLSVYSSFGYLSDEGYVDNSKYERYTGRLRANYQVKPWLTFGSNFSYAHSKQNSVYNDGSWNGASVFSQVKNMAPIYPLYVRDGNGKILYDQNGRVYDWGNGLYNENSQIRPNGTNTNNLNSIYIDFMDNKSNNINADAFADVTFLKDFKFTFKVGTNVDETRYNYTTNPFYGYNAQQNGVLSVYHYRTTTFNMQQLLNWNKTIDKHHLSVMAGHENYKYNYTTLSASKTGAADYFNNMELDGYLSTYGIPSSSYSDYMTEGWLFRAMYDWDDRYYGQFSFRRDASSRFHPDHRWGNFWSAGAAWIINKESWFDVDWIDFLKLKISYGEQGNDQIGDYRYTNLYDITNVDGQLTLGFSSKGNKDISWEKSENLNVGVEFEFLKKRLTGSLEFYNRVTRDMLMWFSTPITLGYSGYYKNVGDLRNRGLELSLSGTPIKTRNFEWGLSMNLTWNKQEVTYLDPANKSRVVDGYEGYQSGNDYFVGEGLPLGSFYIVKYAGVSDDGRTQWYLRTDEGDVPTTNYSQASYYIVKNDKPIFGGFGTSFSLFGVDISAQFAYQLGGWGCDSQYAALMSSPTANVTGNALHKDILNAWSTENPNSNIPRFQYGDEYVSIISDRWLIKNSFISLQNMQIGYTIPVRFVKKFGLSKLRVYASGDNLFLWSKRKGYDPRYASGSGIYSPMRAISGGINLQF
ncbi:MAG: SusC/RagA family TonB-linked outer membrane protein [Bacteroides sp.]